MQLAFLIQESLVDDEDRKLPNHRRASAPQGGHVLSPVEEGEATIKRKADEELYRSSIKCITDLLTIAKLIDDRALLTTVYINQAFFHAACAYSRDMLNHVESVHPPFPIPNETSPSMVFHFPRNSIPSTGSHTSVESTYIFLTLIAKTHYHFLRQAIKDMAKVYAGAGWLDATLDQRESGLRDVDLSKTSDAISTFIRLHDLRGPGESEMALKKVSKAGYCYILLLTCLL